jgi:hypothetical protein
MHHYRSSREYVTLLVIKGVLRHAKPAPTAGYIHRVNAVHLSAHGKSLDAIKVANTDV